jgi:hypothetical protein
VDRFFKKLEEIIDFNSFVMIILCIIVFKFLFYEYFDKVNLKETMQEVKTGERRYFDAYDERRLSMNDNVVITESRHVKETWFIDIILNDEVIGCPISEHQYQTIHSGQVVSALIITGRFNGKKYCNGVVDNN